LGFASDVAVYLGKDMRQAQGYSETLIGSRMYLSEWYYLQLPWRTFITV